MTRPRIAITMGDPAGIGPEICLRLLSHEPTLSRCVPIVFGDANVLERAVEHCGFGKVPRVVQPGRSGWGIPFASCLLVDRLPQP